VLANGARQLRPGVTHRCDVNWNPPCPNLTTAKPKRQDCSAWLRSSSSLDSASTPLAPAAIALLASGCARACP
jgi:hypothetical protein